MELKSFTTMGHTAAEQAEYDQYKLSHSIRYIRAVIVAAFVFNLLLLAPDLNLIDDGISRIFVTVLRSGYSAALLVLFLNIRRFRSYRAFSRVITVYELAASLIFLYVLYCYVRPDYMIQSLGVMIMTMIIFLLPNQGRFKISVAVMNAGGFLLEAGFYFMAENTMEFWASVVYIIIAIGLCAVINGINDSHELQDFLIRRELLRVGTVDQLTHAANRYKLCEEGSRWMDFCRRQKLPLSLVLIDVDDLKTVNDGNGHQIGDAVLVRLVRLIASQLRSTDILSRWGGDEFVLLLPNTGTQEALAVSERIRKHIAEHLKVHNNSVTCSFGIAEMSGNESLEELISLADKRMYAGKRQGKNTVQY